MYREVETSTYQASHLSKLADELGWEVKEGASSEPLLSEAGTIRRPAGLQPAS